MRSKYALRGEGASLQRRAVRQEEVNTDVKRDQLLTPGLVFCLRCRGRAALRLSEGCRVSVRRRRKLGGRKDARRRYNRR